MHALIYYILYITLYTRIYIKYALELVCCSCSCLQIAQQEQRISQMLGLGTVFLWHTIFDRWLTVHHPRVGRMRLRIWHDYVVVGQRRQRQRRRRRLRVRRRRGTGLLVLIVQLRSQMGVALGWLAGFWEGGLSALMMLIMRSLLVRLLLLLVRQRRGNAAAAGGLLAAAFFLLIMRKLVVQTGHIPLALSSGSRPQNSLVMSAASAASSTLSLIRSHCVCVAFAFVVCGLRVATGRQFAHCFRCVF